MTPGRKVGSVALMGVMSEARLYLVGSIVMGIAAIVVLCAHNYLAASAMLMSSALAG